MHQTFGALPLLDLWAARRRRRGKRARAVVACSIMITKRSPLGPLAAHASSFLSEKPVLLDTVRARDVIAGAWSRPRDFPGAINSFNNTHLTQRIASGSGAPGANAVSRSRLSASVTGHFSFAAVVWNQVMTVVKGQSQGCLAWVWNSLPLL